jgi:hypothetical protein
MKPSCHTNLSPIPYPHMLESSKSHDISPITKKTNKKYCESTFIHGLPIFVLYAKCVEKMKVHEFGTLQVPN